MTQNSGSAELSLGRVEDVGYILTPEEYSQEADCPFAIVPATMLRPRVLEGE